MVEPVRAFVVLESGVSRAEIEAAISNGVIEIVVVAKGIDEGRARLHETPYDVIVIGIGIGIGSQSEEVLRFIDDAVRERRRLPVIVIAHGSPDGFTMRLFAAGADDVIIFPVAPDEVLFAFEKALARKAADTDSATFSQAPLICVFGPKGGTGKTVTATSLSVALAELGKSVALIDLDLQFGDVALAMGMSPESTIFDLVRTGGSLDKDKLSDFMLTHSSGVRLLLAPRRPDHAAVVSVDFLRQLYSTVRLMVDYVVVDTPPGFTPEVIATIDSATTVCMIGMLDVLSLKNTRLGLDTLDLMGFPDENVKLILNRAGSRVGISDDEVMTLWRREPDILVPSDREIVRAVNAGESILVANPNSEAARAFRDLARQITEAEEPSEEPVGRGSAWQRIGLTA